MTFNGFTLETTIPAVALLSIAAYVPLDIPSWLAAITSLDETNLYEVAALTSRHYYLSFTAARVIYEQDGRYQERLVV